MSDFTMKKLSEKMISLVFIVLFIAVSISTVQAACPTSTPADYSGKTINGFNFGACREGSLIGSNFKNANLSGSTFVSADLTGADFTSANLGPTDSYPAVSFSSAKLEKTNFEYSTINCADFSDTNLIQANFGATQNIVSNDACRTNFTKSELSVNLITDPQNPGARGNWGSVDFTSAKFQDMNPSKVNFEGQNISNAILKDTNFTGFNFTGANLEKVKFDNAKLDSTVFDNAVINGIVLDYSSLIGSSFICVQGYGNTGGTTRADGSKCKTATGTSSPTLAVSMVNSNATGADFTGVTFSHAIFSGATLTRSIFKNANLSQSSFIAQGTTIGPALVNFTTFDNANLSQAKVSSVIFSGASLLAVNLSSTTLSNTVFSTSKLDQANFSDAIIQGANFTYASLKSANFSNANISMVSGGGASTDFSCAQIGGADFSQATISAGVFNNAVMVDLSYCCPSKVAGAPATCGYIDSLGGVAYAQTVFPNITGSAIKCPNGSTAKPAGSGVTTQNQCPSLWKLSSNWKTTGCTVSGEETMWGIDCSAKPGDYVVFADDNLKKCILDSISGSPTEVLITVAENIQSVNCPSRGITSIGGLEYFKKMHTLDLSDNDLAAVSLHFKGVNANHTMLVTLNIEENKLTSLDLTNVASIEFLNVANNKLTGISLNANTYLVTLNAQNNKISAINLPTQSNLIYADLSSNLLTDVLGPYSKDLSVLTSLSFLDLSDNSIKTIGSIATIAGSEGSKGSLNNLYLACNPKFSCGDLKIYDGTTYPAAATSGCSVYNAPDKKWVAQTNPICN